MHLTLCGTKLDMEKLAALVSDGKFNELPAPFGFKNPAPVKHLHIIFIPSATSTDVYDVIKYMTFSRAVGYKVLFGLCYGNAKQFDAPDSGARAKGSRVALHRLFMSINRIHVTNFAVKEVGEDDADPNNKKKLQSDEDIDAAFDLIREDYHAMLCWVV